MLAISHFQPLTIDEITGSFGGEELLFDDDILLFSVCVASATSE